MVLGDSLSAAYQMPVKAGWVSLAQKQLGSGVKFINAAVSGETTAGARRTLPTLIEAHQPDLVILEIGANDGLRGHPPVAIKMNLTDMIEMSLASGAKIALVEMDIPANYGEAYRRAFKSVYSDLASRLPVTLIPSVFDDIFGKPELLQEDGLHPNEQAQVLIKDAIISAVEPILDSL